MADLSVIFVQKTESFLRVEKKRFSQFSKAFLMMGAKPGVSQKCFSKKMEEHLQRLERLRLAEYIAYVDDHRRLMRSHFLSGLARGVGMAIGFSVLGALLVWILQDLAKRNLPLIGDILAYIMEAIRPD